MGRMGYLTAPVVMRRHFSYDQSSSNPKELFGMPEMLFVFLHEFIRQAGEIFLAKSCHQECSCDNIVYFSVFIPKRSVERQSLQFSIFVTDNSYGVIKGIYGLDISANGLLKRFKPRHNIRFIRCFFRFYN